MRNYTGMVHHGGRPTRGGFKDQGVSVRFVMSARPLEDDLAQLRKELAKPCPEPDFRVPGSENLTRMAAWMDWALAQKDGQVAAFPEHDVLLSTKTCIDRKLQAKLDFPFYLLQEGQEGAPASAPPADLRQMTWPSGPMSSPANGRAFDMVAKPDCFQAVNPWDHLTRQPRLSRYRGRGGRPPIGDLAVADSDIWSNIGHSLSSMFFLASAMRSDFLRRGNETKRFVPVQRSVEGVKKFSVLHQTWADALGLSEHLKKEVRVFHSDTKVPAPECYSAVAQRLWMWPPSPKSYTFRDDVLRHCGLPDRGMCRKMFFWFKQEAGHNVFPNLDWVNRTLGQFARSVGLEFRMMELTAAEVAAMTPCEQMGIFTDLALYVGVHGAAGLHHAWLPRGAAYVEIAPSLFPGGRTTNWRGYHGHPAAMGGRLYLHYEHAVPLRHVDAVREVHVNKYLALDAEELVEVLKVVYSAWLRPLLKVSKCRTQPSG